MSNLVRSIASLCLILACASEAAAAAKCTAIAGGSTRVAAVSSGAVTVSKVEASGNAIDGDPATAASLLIPLAVNGKQGLRVTAQRGIVFASGSKAGVRFEIQKTASAAVSMAGTVRTYLGTALQNEYTFDSRNAVDINGVGSSGGLVTVRATKPFNAVELLFDGSLSGYTVEVFEFCSDVR
ncbi:MAG: hypothetical protein EPN60_04135 [Nevskiaceae bacterium]|jgi:hypothetical protein|nr:MAG: hypothetical protein EPO48_06420 [Nevskiaceae bacterium]TAM31844.1 MAG: hypothetical protein EPN60_04135 [Nevskiaceae bacterium]